MASAETPDSVIHRFSTLLDASDVPYMLTGSFACGFHGFPRATHDIDFVIAPVLRTLSRFIDSLPDDAYYVDRRTALEAYGNESLFNVIDMSSGWKVDFICRKSREYSVTNLSDASRATWREGLYTLRPQRTVSCPNSSGPSSLSPNVNSTMLLVSFAFNKMIWTLAMSSTGSGSLA